MELKILKGREVLDSGLAEQIIEFDKRAMQPIFEKTGIEFPEERRRRGLENNPTFIVASDERGIAGYIEYSRSWNNPDYIYVGSIQIDQRHRCTSLILSLLDKFRSLVSLENFAGFEANVQKVNRQAIKMYRKIGFQLEDNPRNQVSLTARAGKDLLENSPIIPLLEKWRHKRRIISDKTMASDIDAQRLS